MRASPRCDEIGAMSPIEQLAFDIRRTVFRHVLDNGGGYLSQACSSAELLATLYGELMHLGPSEVAGLPQPFAGVPGAGAERRSGRRHNGPLAPDLDRLVFSPAHYALVLYATLIASGRLHPRALEAFDQDGSTLEMIGAEHSPGFELTTGSLAQALSTAGGIALARRLRGDSGHVWVFMSDGEFQEGQTWEAIAALAFHQLDNLTVVVDVNGQQCDGRMSAVMSIEPLARRIESFGATAREVDGHDIEQLIAAAGDRGPGRPTFVLGRTDPARGIDLLRQRAPLLHSLTIGSEQELARWRQAYQELYG